MTNLRIDVAGGQIIGAREHQEDAYAIGDIPPSNGRHLAVLADGMGGHVAGATAARAVVDAFMEAMSPLTNDVAKSLKSAVVASNLAVGQQTRNNPDLDGMGSTVVGIAIADDCLYWVSVGDSLLYHVSNNRLRRLNADHSLAGQIDAAAQRGEISWEEARNSTRRHILRSAIMGSDIALIDLPENPVKLMPGDTILMASDGLETLSIDALAELLSQRHDASAMDTTTRVLKELVRRDAPRQDNVTVIAVTLTPTEVSDDVPTRPLRPNDQP
ncbi:MAG: protein phosphatase 2C domain-containing protein [Pseudomonadota bacterium]